MSSDQDICGGRKAGDDRAVGRDILYQVAAIKKLHHNVLVRRLVAFSVESEKLGRPSPRSKIFGLGRREGKEGVVSWWQATSAS